MSNLVIVESPAKANTIKGYLGQNYKVIASKGHVRDLPKSSLGVDIENKFAAKYINIRGKGDLIAELKKEAKNADKVFLATDPDREGEAISWHLANALKLPENKTFRVTFNEVTKTAIKAAIKKPREIDMDLVNSQQTRRILDRIVGYKTSPILWKSIKSGLSAGRVQSVTTRIIVEREEEIRAFVPTEYWTIEATLEKENKQSFKAAFYGDAKNKIELRNKEDADKVLAAINGKPFTVDSVKKAVRSRNPAPPFITSSMQQEASRKLGFQSQRIMRVAQELYEGIHIGSENGGVQGLITYMRTDSLRISKEASDAASDYIKAKYGEEYAPETRRVYKSKANAQDAHEAIRPSNLKFEPEKIKGWLTPDQYKLYKLIWDRFLASQMSSALLDTVNAEIECGGYFFRAAGHTVKFPGFMVLYEASEEETGEADQKKIAKIPEIAEKELLKAKKISPDQHFTEAPPRYTEASLIKFLEEKGIGRPSTYTPIITTILTRGYISRDGKSLKPTQLGEVTTRLMKQSFPEIVDYEFTAQLETKLDDIESGSHTMLEVLDEFYGDFEKSLKAAESNPELEKIEIPQEETDIICDKCGARMVVKNGRFGKFAACPNYPTCKNTRPLDKNGKPVDPKANPKPVEKTDMKCEKCGADMVLRTGRFGSFYACSNYPTCKNTKQIHKDIGVLCPKCGGKVVVKRSKNKNVFYSCENYPTCDFSSWDLPLDKTCPNCGQMLFRKKGKNLIICHNPDCGYKQESEAEGKTGEDHE